MNISKIDFHVVYEIAVTHQLAVVLLKSCCKCVSLLTRPTKIFQLGTERKCINWQRKFIHKHIEGETIWPSFCDSFKHFCWMTLIVFWLKFHCSDNSLALNRREPIACINYGPVNWRIYPYLSLTDKVWLFRAQRKRSDTTASKQPWISYAVCQPNFAQIPEGLILKPTISRKKAGKNFIPSDTHSWVVPTHVYEQVHVSCSTNNLINFRHALCSNLMLWS